MLFCESGVSTFEVFNFISFFLSFFKLEIFFFIFLRTIKLKTSTLSAKSVFSSVWGVNKFLFYSICLVESRLAHKKKHNSWIEQVKLISLTQVFDTYTNKTENESFNHFANVDFGRIFFFMDCLPHFGLLQSRAFFSRVLFCCSAFL